MTIGGLSVILILGLINLFLIMFQIASGKKWIKVPLQVHRLTGRILFLTAVLHAALALLVS